MKQLYTFIFLCLGFSVATFAQRSNCAASPYPIDITQVDGSVLTIRMQGTEMLHHRETAEGYTVLRNAEGIYEYAILDNRGYLTLSGIKAKNNIAETGLNKNLPAKHLRYNDVQKQAIIADFNAMNVEALKMNEEFYKATPKVDYPTLGNIKILAICMQFPDEQAIYPISDISDMLNTVGYSSSSATGSFKDYFIANSYGQCNPTVDVIGWYTTTKNRVQYGSNSANYMSNVRELVARAIDSADIRGNVDFTQYDNDNDGKVDGIFIFHAGYGAEQGKAGYIWSHRSTISTVTKDGKTIRDYCINPLKREWGGSTRMVGLGVLTHEWGHVMGLPDLYDTNTGNGDSEGIGEWGLMGACGWLNQERTPCMHDAWSRIQFGWLEERYLVQPGSYELKASADSAACYRINTTRPNEYYLIENRQKKNWDFSLKGRGMAIWHINTQRTSLFPGNNSVNADTAAYGVGLIQADGQRHLELNANRGDAGDLYPGSTNNTQFNNTSNPAPLLHYKIGGVKQPANISIFDITQGADSIIRFKYGAFAAASFQAQQEVGCAPLTVKFTNQSTGVANFEWKFANGATNTTDIDPTFTFTNAGTYTVTLVISDSTGLQDSASRTIIVHPVPVATASIERDGNKFTFTNTSTGADFYTWIFGTNQTNNSASPVYTLTQPGWLPFKMIAFTNSGCTDTLYGEIDYWFLGTEKQHYALGNVSAFPNPTSNDATLQFSLRIDETVTAEVFNMLGEKTGTISNQLLQSGTHTLSVSQEMISASGVYFIKLKAGSQQTMLKLVKQ